MAASNVQLLALSVLLIVCASQITASRDLKHDSCFTPTSQDDLPQSQGTFDVNAPFLCFGFQLAATHPLDPVETKLQTLFDNNANVLLNPYATLSQSAAEAPIVNRATNSRLYYPLDAAYGTGVAGTGFRGAGFQKNPTTGAYVASFAFRLEDLSGNNVTTPLINRVLRNVGNWVTRHFPVAGAKASRPGVTAFQVTTWFVRQDFDLNNGTNITVQGEPIFNETTGNFTVPMRLIPAGCKYI